MKGTNLLNDCGYALEISLPLNILLQPFQLITLKLAILSYDDDDDAHVDDDDDDAKDADDYDEEQGEGHLIQNEHGGENFKVLITLNGKIIGIKFAGVVCGCKRTVRFSKWNFNNKLSTVRFLCLLQYGM